MTVGHPPQTAGGETGPQPALGRTELSENLRQRPCVLWLTGLSGAGKTTLAIALQHQLQARGHHTALLDGDAVRHGLCADLGFDAASRHENIRRAGHVARLMSDAGLIVIAAFISPFRRDRDAARAASLPGEFLEIHVDVPLAVAEARDPKGLYRRARRGELPEFTGIASPYEPPQAPDLRLDNAALQPAEAVQQILELMKSRGFTA